MRRGTAELLGETSMAIEQRSGQILVARREFDYEREKRRGKVSTIRFIGEQGHGRREKRLGVNRPASPQVLNACHGWLMAWWVKPPWMASAITGTAKKEGEGSS